MKLALASLAILLGCSTHVAAQCVPQAEKVISADYKVSVECGKYRNGPITPNIPSPEACAALCRDSPIVDAVCSYQKTPKQQNCMVAKPDAEIREMPGIYLMTPIKDSAADICREDLKECLASDAKCAADLAAAQQALKDKEAELAEAKKKLSATQADLDKAKKDLDKAKADAAKNTGGGGGTTPPGNTGGYLKTGLNCGGRLRADGNADLLRALKNTKAPACKAACLRDPACHAWNLWSKGNFSQCYLLNKSARDVQSHYKLEFQIFDRNCPDH